MTMRADIKLPGRLHAHPLQPVRPQISAGSTSNRTGCNAPIAPAKQSVRAPARGELVIATSPGQAAMPRRQRTAGRPSPPRKTLILVDFKGGFRYEL